MQREQVSLFFSYICFSKFNFIPFKVSTLNIAVWVMHENLENATCLSFRYLIVIPSFEWQNATLFSPSLYSIFLSISPEKIKLPSKYQGVSKFSFFFFPNTLQIVNHFILAVEFFDENDLSVKRDLVLHEKWRSGKDDAKKRRSGYILRTQSFLKRKV